MSLTLLDWSIISIYFIFILGVGLYFSKRSGSSLSQYFLSGRDMPWWLLGLSMVATTFSADTPNLVTDLVRQQGVSGNWGWWAFLLTGMLTVFVFSKLWRRSMVLTDIEFYELRYSGRLAEFLRGFRALYLGLVFNILIMGAVSLAAIKFGEIVLGMPGWQTLLIAGSVTILYSYFGGLKAVIITDFVQFVLAMIGSVLACIYIINLDQVGGLHSLLNHELIIPKKSMLPNFNDPNSYIPVLVVPLLIQWWSSYYPGAEPGGGGYIAQRMFSAKNEKHAVGATLLFNIAHYALRPWPWILIALASIIIYPNLSDIQTAFPQISENKVGHDLAYPAMLSFLPSGLLGLVAASLIAAFMSTMSTQMNLGSSYLVNDFYQRFINPKASEKELIKYAKLFTLVTAILGLALGLALTSASEAFNYLLILGAGTGLLYIVRWFWWRINALTEIVAMVSSIIVAIGFYFIQKFVSLESWQVICFGTLTTTLAWIIAALISKPTSDEKLRSFYEKIQPGGIGWKPFLDKMRKQGKAIQTEKTDLNLGMSLWIISVISVYAALFAAGNWIYGNVQTGILLTAISVLGISFILWAFSKKMKFK